MTYSEEWLKNILNGRHYFHMNITSKNREMNLIKLIQIFLIKNQGMAVITKKLACEISIDHIVIVIYQNELLKLKQQKEILIKQINQIILIQQLQL